MNPSTHRAVLPVLALAAMLGAPAGSQEPAASPPAAGPAEAAPAPSQAPAAGMEYGTRARLVDKPPIPEYPDKARRRGQEGWVQLSFTVRPDGTVVDPIVEDSTGIVEFERAAIASVLRARYAPATWQGRPIEQCASRMMYYFTIDGRQIGARREFIRPWREASDLAREQRYAEAEAKLDAMARDGAWSNYEISRLWLLRASVQAGTGDKAGQLRSLRRATASRGSDLERDLYRQALLQRFALEVQLSQYGPALETHSRMLKLEPPLVDSRVEKAVAEIDRAIHNTDTLGFPGVVEFRSGCEEGRPNWQHELLRRTFAFDHIEGKVDDFELRCDWKRVVDRVSTDKTWQVPVSWGWCQVFVFGEQGAKVTLVELPLAAGEEGARPSRVSLN